MDNLSAEDARNLRRRQPARTKDYIDDQIILMSILSAIRESALKGSTLSYITDWLPPSNSFIWGDLRNRGFKLSFPNGGRVIVDWSN